MEENKNTKGFERLSNEAYARLSTEEKVTYLRRQQEAFHAGPPLADGDAMLSPKSATKDFVGPRK